MPGTDEAEGDRMTWPERTALSPYYEDGVATIYHGDCRDIARGVMADAVISDPPYGMNWNTDHTRFQTGPNCDRPVSGRRSNQRHARIASDNEPFDPQPWIGYPSCVLWGFQHYSSRLPAGTVLVWLKRYDDGLGSFLSDADLAWMKGGHGVYCRRDVSLQGESRVHPTQKPERIMEWCVGLATKPGQTILDPFMGSGTTLVAAKRLGRKAIGIELEEKYCEIAAKRLAQGALDLFGEATV